MRAGRDSVWGALEVLRERWSFLVIREAFFGVHRFGDLRRNLGIAKNILSDRLQHLVAEGILERHPYQDRPAHHEYRLTEKGLDLYPIIMTLMRWGDRWLAGEGAEPLILRHRTCGQPFTPVVTCSICGGHVHARDVTYEPGPGLADALADQGEDVGTLPIRPLVEP